MYIIKKYDEYGPIQRKDTQNAQLGQGVFITRTRLVLKLLHVWIVDYGVAHVCHYTGLTLGITRFTDCNTLFTNGIIP